jgi:hypothetical protein
MKYEFNKIKAKYGKRKRIAEEAKRNEYEKHGY